MLTEDETRGLGVALNEAAWIHAYVDREHSRSAREVLRKLRVASLRGALGTWQTPVGMIFRDLRAFRPYDGPTEVHEYAIAREVLR